MPSDDTKPWEELDIAQDMAIRDFVAAKQRDFLDYVIGEAGETLHADHFDRDTVTEAIHILDTNRFDVVDQEDGSSEAIVCAHGDAYEELRRGLPLERTDDGPDHMIVAGADVYADRAMPENHAIVLHPDATAPSHPQDIERPWIVKRPDGVVVVRLEDDDAG